MSVAALCPFSVPTKSRAAGKKSRCQLVTEHLPMVRALARALHMKYGHLKPGPDLDDLVSYGSKGLIEASRRFDSTQGTSFRTFAYYRVRGAMLDGIREMGALSRQDCVRRRAGLQAPIVFVEVDDRRLQATTFDDSPDEVVE